MDLKVERVVTEVTPDGRSVFADRGSPRQAPASGLDIVNVWGTGDGIATVGIAGQEPVLFPFFPGPGGSRVVVVHFPPESASDSGHADETDPEQAQPGLLAAFEPDHPGMHTTDSIDYGICLSGDLYLELDDGAEQHITPGAIVVQQGTRHAWRNRSAEVCTMVYVLIGARRS